MSYYGSMIKVNYMDVLGSVKYWDILIYNELRKKVLSYTKVERKKTERFEGGYVKRYKLVYISGLCLLI